MIVKHHLLNFGSNIIYQDDELFDFSLDSLLLANFATLNLSTKKILDLCTGNAPIPMLLTFKTEAEIYGLELQKYIYDLGLKSIKENKMDNKIVLINDNIKNYNLYFPCEEFDLITCNPPYFKYNNSKYLNDNDMKSIARHEINITLEEVIEVSSKLLKNKGRLCLVHRPERLIEIIMLMRKYGIEPKKMRLVYPKKNKEANILLIEGMKNGHGALKIESPLITHYEDGSYNEEIKKMFGD